MRELNVGLENKLVNPVLKRILVDTKNMVVVGLRECLFPGKCVLKSLLLGCLPL
jgi:hypothetical protein